MLTPEPRQIDPNLDQSIEVRGDTQENQLEEKVEQAEHERDQVSEQSENDRS